jgi:hypothetical protein
MNDGLLRVRNAQGQLITLRFACEEVEFFELSTEFLVKLRPNAKFVVVVEERRKNERRKK